MTCRHRAPCYKTWTDQALPDQTSADQSSSFRASAGRMLRAVAGTLPVCPRGNKQPRCEGVGRMRPFHSPARNLLDELLVRQFVWVNAILKKLSEEIPSHGFVPVLG